MLAGMDFATCSDEDFRNYIVGWTFVWSGIIPYTFIAAKVGIAGPLGPCARVVRLSGRPWSRVLCSSVTNHG